MNFSKSSLHCLGKHFPHKFLCNSNLYHLKEIYTEFQLKRSKFSSQLQGKKLGSCEFSESPLPLALCTLFHILISYTYLYICCTIKKKNFASCNIVNINQICRFITISLHLTSLTVTHSH